MEQFSAISQPEDPDEEAPEPPRRIGPLSDQYEEGGPAFYPSLPRALEGADLPDAGGADSVESLIQSLHEGRNSTDEVTVDEERERIRSRRQQVEGALELATDAAEVQKLESVQEKLETEEQKMDLAGEMNGVLEAFSELSDDELKSLRDNGVDKEGNAFEHKGKHLNPKIAKSLAQLASKGVKRLTWGALKEVFTIADVLLNDFFYPIKKILHFSE